MDTNVVTRKCGENNKQRNAAVELLRIVAMLIIIILHYIVHSGITDDVTGFNYYLIWTVKALGSVAVNVYVLISGYFLSTSQFNLKRLIQILLQVMIYSIGIYLAYVAAVWFIDGKLIFNLKSLIVKYAIPTISGVYWFVSCYVVMYVCSPFMNISVKAMGKKAHKSCVAVLLLLFSVIPNFVLGASSYFSVSRGYSIIWFIVLYFIAAYIRLYVRPNGKIKKYLLLYFLPLLFAAVFKFTQAYLTVFLFKKEKVYWTFYDYNSLPVLIASVAFFILFLNLKIDSIKLSKIICSISALTFGVYLIHDNPLIRPVLWKTIVKPSQYSGSPLLFLHLFAWAIIIFVVCALLEYVRKLLFKPIFEGEWLNRFCGWAAEKWNRIIKE